MLNKTEKVFFKEGKFLFGDLYSPKIKEQNKITQNENIKLIKKNINKVSSMDFNFQDEEEKKKLTHMILEEYFSKNLDYATFINNQHLGINKEQFKIFEYYFVKEKIKSKIFDNYMTFFNNIDFENQSIKKDIITNFFDFDNNCCGKTIKFDYDIKNNTFFPSENSLENLTCDYTDRNPIIKHNMFIPSGKIIISSLGEKIFSIYKKEFNDFLKEKRETTIKPSNLLESFKREFLLTKGILYFNLIDEHNHHETLVNLSHPELLDINTYDYIAYFVDHRAVVCYKKQASLFEKNGFTYRNMSSRFERYSLEGSLFNSPNYLLIMDKYIYDTLEKKYPSDLQLNKTDIEINTKEIDVHMPSDVNISLSTKENHNESMFAFESLIIDL